MASLPTSVLALSLAILGRALPPGSPGAGPGTPGESPELGKDAPWIAKTDALAGYVRGGGQTETTMADITDVPRAQ